VKILCNSSASSRPADVEHTSGVQASVLAHVPGLSSLELHVGSDYMRECTFGKTSLDAVVKGVRASHMDVHLHQAS
jgi:hypothetical protein